MARHQSRKSALMRLTLCNPGQKTLTHPLRMWENLLGIKMVPVETGEARARVRVQVIHTSSLISLSSFR